MPELGRPAPGVGAVIARACDLAVRAGVPEGRVRTDAVTWTCAAMLGQQICEGVGAWDVPLTNPTLGDEQVAANFADLAVLLQHALPQVFPAGSQPDWPDKAVAGLARAWAGVDLAVGRRHLPYVDAVAVAFIHAASMRSRQRSAGAFYTPLPVCLSLAMAVGLAGPRPWTESVYEPCVGAGTMLVARWHLLSQAIRQARLGARGTRQAVAQAAGSMLGVDVDAHAAWTARANLAVRLGFDVPVVVGDALTFGVEDGCRDGRLGDDGCTHRLAGHPDGRVGEVVTSACVQGAMRRIRQQLP